LAAFACIAVDDARTKLRHILALGPLYPRPVQITAAMCASACASVVFFGGGWAELITSGVLSLMVAFMGIYSATRRFSRVYEFVAAFFVGMFAMIVDKWIAKICLLPTVIAGVLNMLAGITLTLAVVELLTGNSNSGTSRLTAGVLVTAMVGFGLELGIQAGSKITGLPQDFATGTCDAAFDERWFFLLFPLMVLGFLLTINPHWTQLLHMVVIATCGYGVSYATPKLGQSASNIISAFVVGIVSNLYSRWSDNTAMTGVVAGLLVLVPGSLALRSVLGLFETDAVQGLQVGVAVLVVAVSLGLGLFLATLVLLPSHASRIIAPTGAVAPSSGTRGSVLYI